MSSRSLEVGPMLKRMRFIHKVVLMPAVAGIGFLMILVVALITDRSNARLLASIEGGHLQAVEITSRLDRNLAEVQENMEDGVETKDLSFLKGIDEYRDLFF